MSKPTGGRSKAKARQLGAFAGQDCAKPLWDLSKRELVEIAIRLGALTSGDCDSADAGVRAALHEHQTLVRSGIV